MDWQQVRIEPYLPDELKRQLAPGVVVYDASQPSADRGFIAAAIMVVMALLAIAIFAGSIYSGLAAGPIAVALICGAVAVMAGRSWWNNRQRSRSCDELYRSHGQRTEARVLYFEDRDLSADTSSFHLYFQFRPEFVIHQELNANQLSTLRNRNVVTIQHLNADPRVARLARD